MKFEEIKPVMKSVSMWITLFLLVLAAGFAVVLEVQSIQLYILKKDNQRLELLLEEYSDEENYVGI